MLAYPAPAVCVVEAGEICVDCRRPSYCFGLGQPHALSKLILGERPTPHSLRLGEPGLRHGKHILFLGIHLNTPCSYHPPGLPIVPQRALKPIIHVVPPPVHLRIATLITRHIKVPAGPITDVMREVVLELRWEWRLVDAAEDHTGSGEFGLGLEAMHGIMAEQPAIIILDVLVPTGPVGPVVHHFALDRGHFVASHRCIKIILAKLHK